MDTSLHSHQCQARFQYYPLPSNPLRKPNPCLQHLERPGCLPCLYRPGLMLSHSVFKQELAFSTWKNHSLILAASNSTLQPRHTSAGRPPTSTVGQKGPGPLSMVMDSASVRRVASTWSTPDTESGQHSFSGADDCQSVMSPSLSCVSLYSDNSHWCGCHSRDHDSFYSVSPPSCDSLATLLS